MQVNDGGPVHPTNPDNYGRGRKYSGPGMSLRDHFAGLAMASMVQSREYAEGGWDQSDIAKQAYQMAGEMIRARQEQS